MESQLTEVDIRAFLLRAYFKNASEPLRASIDRAYRDMSRTLTGFQNHADKSGIRANAEVTLNQRITDQLSSPSASQDVFDSWHRTTCDALKNDFRDFHLHYGQAQKWINMSLKYLFILDRGRVLPVWPRCHVPIDLIILSRVAEHDLPKFDCAWSRIDSYDQYLCFQNKFRNKFGGISMDAEWRIWMDPANAVTNG